MTGIHILKISYSAYLYFYCLDILDNLLPDVKAALSFLFMIPDSTPTQQLKTNEPLRDKTNGLRYVQSE